MPISNDKRTILVTGGAGYIGSHVVRALEESGYCPLVFDNLSTGNREHLLGTQLIVGDLAEPQHLDEVFARHPISAVIHFAARIQVEESVREPLAYYRNNVVNTLNLLETCRRHGVSRFVFSSTAAVYGIPDLIPVPETAPLQPINPYGMSKRTSEAILRDLSAADSSFRYIALRYFNVAGADLKGRIGQKYPKPTHLITLALHAALGLRPRLSVFGQDYDTPDGTCIRDYIHVHDLAQAHVLALESLFGGSPSGIYNCGYGKGSSVLDVIRAVEYITGKKLPTLMEGRRAGDPPVLIADAEKIKTSLGWKPSCDQIELMVETAWKWEKKLHGL